MWDKKMHQCMYQAGFLSVEGSPGFFYHPTLGVERTVYVDDFVLIAPPSDPAVEVSRYLGVYHHFGKLPDGTITCATEAKSYLTAAVKRYMTEIGVKDLSYVPSPSIEDKFDDASAFPGKQAKNAASHLMSILYVARLVRANVVTNNHLPCKASFKMDTQRGPPTQAHDAKHLAPL